MTRFPGESKGLCPAVSRGGLKGSDFGLGMFVGTLASIWDVLSFVLIASGCENFGQSFPGGRGLFLSILVGEFTNQFPNSIMVSTKTNSNYFSQLG